MCYGKSNHFHRYDYGDGAISGKRRRLCRSVSNESVEFDHLVSL